MYMLRQRNQKPGETQLRTHPHLIGMRVTDAERDLIATAASRQGLSVSQFLRDIVLPIAIDLQADAVSSSR